MVVGIMPQGVLQRTSAPLRPITLQHPTSAMDNGRGMSLALSEAYDDKGHVIAIKGKAIELLRKESNAIVDTKKILTLLRIQSYYDWNFFW